MKQRIEDFLSTAASPETRNVEELKALYKEITGKDQKCLSDTCINKMLTQVRKYYYTEFESQVNPVAPRKHVLKPGNHTFAPGGFADHNNDNTTDAEIDFFLKVYPHIKTLLITN